MRLDADHAYRRFATGEGQPVYHENYRVVHTWRLPFVAVRPAPHAATPYPIPRHRFTPLRQFQHEQVGFRPCLS